ncbi:uncharacterized protein LOC130742814 [Lotus japonicus]|uniref:uncharacterized protein LOC130742814 n=1 Tax=Lotus japonicus TaxID=34305 RepID=UPI002585930C|nr:uncharacterized protein LOC130742814 [Lotus japonicus]XP_057450899.1 uncharacterized protein LOC130742814 [Lotus japonicus]XP_057450900.1 uncharacterized protein LOC130742814 [Lotus japonicus]
MLDTLQKIQSQNEQLQAQVEYLTQRQDYKQEQRLEAEDVVEFQPFVPAITRVGIPKHLQTMVLDAFSGDSDPMEHLRYFNTKMVIGGATDEVKCRLLSSTFKGMAMQWFIRQPPFSIDNFTDLSTKFLTQFSANKTTKATMFDLISIHQQPGEKLKNYMARFSKMAVQLEEDNPDVCLASFKNGLRAGDLNRDLTRRPAKDMMDLRARVQEFILIEQDDQKKQEREEGRKQAQSGGVSQDKPKAGKETRVAQTPRVPRPGPYQNPKPGFQNTWHRNSQGPAAATTGQHGASLAPVPLTKLNAPLSTILRAVGQTNVVQYPPPPRRPPANVDTNRWCEYHKALGHTTDNCWNLRREIDRLIKAGHLANFVKDTATPEVARITQGDKGKGKEIVEELGDPVGECSSIAGGFGGGAISSKARKRYVAAVHSVHEASESECWVNHSPIIFTPQDFAHVIPHDNDPIVVTIRVNNYVTKKVFLDQGYSANIIYGDAFDRLGLKESDLRPYKGTLVGFTGDRVTVRGYVEIPTAFGEGEFVKKFQVKYLVLACRANYNVLLGRDTLNKLCAVISTAHLTVKYPACNGKVGVLHADQNAARECYLRSVALYGRKAAKESHRITEIFPQEGFSLDPRDDADDFRPQPLEETKQVQIKDKFLKIGSSLTKEQEERLITLLSDNLDLFAWTINDVPGIDPNVITHKLAIRPGATPIIQPRRRMSEEKNKAVQLETEKLIKASFIREVQYPTWLANVVMVKKANGKWRMCTDYTSLNKVCPKDSYPLPNVDKLVDGASGNELLSLMDAYSGYNQIMMHPSDEESTTFMTNQANYCYKTMLFGLKNAGATYQRLMDKIFSKQVGRNMEVYVDDMIVKSARASDHGSDLKEAFTQLRTYQMKLNPEKCSFGIQGGKFLGFMLTSRGIEVNPDKGMAILEMKNPTSVKEVQRLTGRMTALSRFLPMAGDKAAPFFTCLKKIQSFSGQRNANKLLPN